MHDKCQLQVDYMFLDDTLLEILDQNHLHMTVLLGR